MFSMCRPRLSSLGDGPCTFGEWAWDREKCFRIIRVQHGRAVLMVAE